MTDLSEDLAVLRESSDVLLQQLTGAQGRVQAVEATDDSGQVVVRLDADGHLESVRVGFTWDQQLSASELPAAVLAAMTEAKIQQVEQYGEALRRIEDEPAPRPRPSRTDTPMLDTFRERIADRGDDGDAAAELVEELLLDARAGLEEANRLLDEHAGRTFAARSTSGHVTATALGNGDIDSVELDQSWVSHAHPANLGREMTEAMLAATRRARREGLAAALQATRLADIARMAVGATTTPEGDGR
ncbi:MAG TPA: YbaB/EbfC family nucleoid-associated protein [Nocardioides sp.]|nr:YbaB/EbfC family nucleoid-associated protein [Nocardioides sp.]